MAAAGKTQGVFGTDGTRLNDDEAELLARNGKSRVVVGDDAYRLQKIEELTNAYVSDARRTAELEAEAAEEEAGGGARERKGQEGDDAPGLRAVVKRLDVSQVQHLPDRDESTAALLVDKFKRAYPEVAVCGNPSAKFQATSETLGQTLLDDGKLLVVLEGYERIPAWDVNWFVNLVCGTPDDYRLIVSGSEEMKCVMWRRVGGDFRYPDAWCTLLRGFGLFRRSSVERSADAW